MSKTLARYHLVTVQTGQDLITSVVFGESALNGGIRESGRGGQCARRAVSKSRGTAFLFEQNVCLRQVVQKLADDADRAKLVCF